MAMVESVPSAASAVCNKMSPVVPPTTKAPLTVIPPSMVLMWIVPSEPFDVIPSAWIVKASASSTKIPPLVVLVALREAT